MGVRFSRPRGSCRVPPPGRTALPSRSTLPRTRRALVQQGRLRIPRDVREQRGFSRQGAARRDPAPLRRLAAPADVLARRVAANLTFDTPCARLVLPQRSRTGLAEMEAYLTRHAAEEDRPPSHRRCPAIVCHARPSEIENSCGARARAPDDGLDAGAASTSGEDGGRRDARRHREAGPRFAHFRGAAALSSASRAALGSASRATSSSAPRPGSRGGTRACSSRRRSARSVA